MLFTVPAQIFLMGLEFKAGTFWSQAHTPPTLRIIFYSLCQQEVDAEKELIRVCSTEPTELKDLPMRIPKESARYHFFLYKHSHEGDYLESTGEQILTSYYEQLKHTIITIHVFLCCSDWYFVSADCLYFFPFSLQSSFILCPGTSVASERGCCIPAAKIPWLTWWKTISRLRLRKR